MKEGLLESFKQNPKALAKLLATGNATLTHTQDKGKWGTEFPRLLMEVRNELKPTTQSDSFYNLKDFTNEERVIILDTMIAKKMSADKNKALIQIEAELLKNKESTIEFLKSCLT